MQITYIETNHYRENPIVQDMLSKTKSYRILTLKDFTDIIPHLKHTKWALENQKWQFSTDQLRLWLGTQEDLCYRDLDSNWNLDDIRPNSICLEGDGNWNDGSFIVTKKDCYYNKFYCELYNRLPENEYETVNYTLHQKYPVDKLDIKPVSPKEGYHAYLSWFNRLVKRLRSPVVYTTMFRDRAAVEIMKGRDVVWFCTYPSDTYYSKYNAHLYQYYFIPKDLFNAQLDYTAKRHITVIDLDSVI